NRGHGRRAHAEPQRTVAGFEGEIARIELSIRHGRQQVYIRSDASFGITSAKAFGPLGRKRS
ncbi:hypothetical protein, partial [Aquisphaera insulae]|uniref:hypothetical protein n=1 Tax=Aquisphaera insulae TaxID=2712864 RepID=UPI00196B8BE6